MSYKLSNIEKETIIIFNESEQTADITIYNSSMIRKLDGLCSSRPDEVKCTESNNYGGKCYTVPKRWVKVNASLILSDEDKAKKAETAKRMVEQRMMKNNTVL
jgi:hypothetical protein